jgi:hypothetical protein
MALRPRAFVSHEVATGTEESASSELIRVDDAQPGVAMRKKARGNDADRVARARTARSRLINQRHVQVDGSRRIILANRAALERPEW